VLEIFDSPRRAYEVEFTDGSGATIAELALEPGQLEPAAGGDEHADATPSSGHAIYYGTGNENAPGDPFGRTELTLAGDAGARLDHRHIGVHRAWTGRVDPAQLEALRGALETAGFPDVTPHQIPGGSTMRELAVDGQRVLIEWYAAENMPGYKEAFAILDSLVRQMSGDSVQATPDTLPPSVSDRRQVV
jgi:hypothetical protein